MAHLAACRAGRVLLHLAAMCGDHCVAFHWAGVMREFHRD